MLTNPNNKKTIPTKSYSKISNAKPIDIEIEEAPLNIR